jgi:hypothetical protein
LLVGGRVGQLAGGEDFFAARPAPRAGQRPIGVRPGRLPPSQDWGAGRHRPGQDRVAAR